MVSRPITVPGLTSKPMIEYTPAVRIRSWIRASRAAPDAFASRNRNAMNSATTTRNTASAISACLVTSVPQEELTSSLLILSAGTFAAVTRAALTRTICAVSAAASFSFSVLIT